MGGLPAARAPEGNVASVSLFSAPRGALVLRVEAHLQWVASES